ncbi:MAG: DUF4912 domain-containing protein, partial [Deltaproteobacteria bacterium]|nr:DUF4912 domain-containing protein [Deltaproteobacteria bacterium]
MKSRHSALPQERLRQIAWEMGRHFPISPSTDFVALIMVTPRRGHVYWHIRPETAQSLQAARNDTLQNAPLTVRIYDVTDIIFNGLNAQRFFDLQVDGLRGNYYFHVDQPARNYLAEIGFRGWDTTYHALARSETTLFERESPARHYDPRGLFVSRSLNQPLPVDNIFEAPVFEELNRQLSRTRRHTPLRVAITCLELSSNTNDHPAFITMIQNTAEACRRLSAQTDLFIEKTPIYDDRDLINSIESASRRLCHRLLEAHKKHPYHIIHCHEWSSAHAAIQAAASTQLPLVISLHSTEHERADNPGCDALSAAICRRERQAVNSASLIIVPRESTRLSVVKHYNARPDTVMLIPDADNGKENGPNTDPARIKSRYGLSPDGPVVLYADEITYAAGADLLVDALKTVCC